MKQYSSFLKHKSKLLVRGYTESGMQVVDEYHISPSLFLEQAPQGVTNSIHRNIYGKPVFEKKFQSVYDANDFTKSYRGSGFRIWGYPRFDYAKIDELFPGTINYDLNLLRVMALDIETEVEGGFPDVRSGSEKINLITISFRKKFVTFGCKDYVNDDPDVRYVKCADEAELLQSFLRVYAEINPDIITGWNVGGFDLPYIFIRLVNVLGESAVNALSPFGMVSRKESEISGRTMFSVDIAGVAILDYLELYQKFELSPRENYKLDTIARVELGETKLHYDCTFKQLYDEHWQDMFVPYNIQDVRLIDRLDEKLGFIAVACSMAYAAKCNFIDVYRVTRVWDNIIANYLREKNIHVITDFRHHGDTYEGAFVKDTTPGLYEWTASFDVASLYPSLIVQYNISPDTILNPKHFHHLRPEHVSNETDEYKLALQTATELNATLCANGAMFTKNHRGFMPELVEAYMKKRVDAKSNMKRCNKAAEAIKAELIKRGAYHEN